MLQNLISNDLYLTFIGQFASFCGLLVCLTISIYGGNEQGKLPETYTYEQFIEYRRAHGTDATKKKLQEIEAKRLEKARNNKKSGGQTKNAGGKHLSKHPITTKKQSLEDNKTKKDKPKKLLDQLGFSSRSKKVKKKDPLAQSDRIQKTKHRSLEADETYIDEPIMRKAASPNGGDHGHGPLVAVPEGGHFDKSHTGSTSTTSPKSPTPPGTTTSPLKSTFYNLDTSNGPRPKRLKDRVPANSNAQTDTGTVKEALTAKEAKTSKERKQQHLQPATFPPHLSTSPKPKSDDDEFTPTVFEIINAPVKPVTEKRTKGQKPQLSHNKQPSTPPATAAPATVKESKKKILQPLEEDKTIEDDCAVDMDDPVPEVKPKPKDLNKIKEKLKEKHQKMIERQKKIDKKKNEIAMQKKLSKDSKKPVDAVTDRATASATKKKQKRKSSNKKDKTVISKPSDKKVSETAAKTSGAIAGTGTAKSPAHQKTPTESKDSDFAGDKTSKELTAEECDKTEEDEEIFTAKDEKLVRGIELRKIQSAKRYVERPPEKLRIIASARIFGHRCENPRIQKATLKAIEKIKKTQKSSMPHKGNTVSKSKSTSSGTSTSSSTPAPTRSPTTTWSTTASESGQKS